MPGAAELRADLERATGLSLPPTLAFDYPTPAEAVNMLAERMVAAQPAADSAADTYTPMAIPPERAAPGGDASGTGRLPAAHTPGPSWALLIAMLPLLGPTQACWS